MIGLCISSKLTSSWPKVSAMEQHFLLDNGALQLAGDSEDRAAERRPTSSEDLAAERHPMSAERPLMSAERHPMSAERHLMSAELHPMSSLLSPDWPRPALQLACDSEDQAAERRPLWSPLSSDSPPPLCLPLAQSSSHHSDDHQPLLCSPCWQLPSARSPWEESPVPPSAGLLPGVPAGAPEPPEHTTSPELPGALRPSARAGEGPLDTETWDPWQPSVCSPSPGPTGWRLHLRGAGCLQCVLRAVSSLSRWAADCWATVLDL
ncbi:hypothetical protein QTO34_014050 [Cnephaeus nilssonii]|uniref:Uncharacterized protein n=1 Tax=Cnephaeus nilssonii TaxID=3371016 RepID=A0AA40I925_CNENI|nr:hypothetical protein QTO34_014050 [Eptesicus nilssonii]